MGHASFQTTTNTYADFDRDKIIESSRTPSTEFIHPAQKVAEFPPFRDSRLTDRRVNMPYGNNHIILEFLKPLSLR